MSLFLTKHHEDILGSGGIAPRILRSRHYTEVSGHLHAPTALHPWKEPAVTTG